MTEERILSEEENACPRCGEKYQLVFGGADAVLDEATLRRLQSFLNR